MILYITYMQSLSMRVERCLRCGKVRELSLMPPSVHVPVHLSVSDSGFAKPVKLQFCTCQEEQEETK